MILVTGGAGYIGSHVNKELHRNGYQTVVFDNLVRGHRAFVKWGQFVNGDLNNLYQLQEVFARFPITAVIHLAAFAYVGESVEHPEEYYMNNVVNSLNLLRVMRENGVKEIVFSSTCATYGIPEHIPIREDHSQKPINPYGRSKLMIEKILTDFERAYGFRYIMLRYFNAAGADPEGEIGELHNPETHLIPLVLEVATGQREHIAIFGDDYATPDGTCIRDYIHVTDLAQAHTRALQHLSAGGRSDAFNLGNGDGYSVKQVIDTTQKITARPVGVVKQARRTGDPPILVGCPEKAHRILKWQPLYPGLETIVATAWQWYRKSLSYS